MTSLISAVWPFSNLLFDLMAMEESKCGFELATLIFIDRPFRYRVIVTQL